ncbi:ATP-binding protein [Chondrinema litorale]|uniref:ATP-binding protein n=1 Tax=Chondrinema litorale TaxID=2994555 RepID=UPI00254399E6|nr:ATP-binding protein [Chondrinema litorale]UZR96950.1 ATP-binding protein [Chondrinema litorale]
MSKKDKLPIQEDISEEFLEQALENCANEPISTPGSIQPHGVLFALDPYTYKIKCVSDNLGLYFDIAPKDALDKSIESILGHENSNLLKRVIINKPLKPIQSIRITIDGLDYDANAHLAGELVVFEVEPVPEQDITLKNDFFYDDLRNFALALRSAKNVDELYDIVVKHIREITGYDRVKLYEFDHEWNGKVVAENKGENIPGYKGLNFPASDIPPQARALYAKNFLRIICDIRYKPSNIIASPAFENKLPLDMTYSVLRSVSPVHIQYLKNMGVSASMSISIMQGGKLWGLVACHHMTGKYLAYRIRMVVELMGHMFSSLLSSFNEVESKEDKESRNSLLSHLSKSLNEKNRIDEPIAKKLIETMKAEGMAFKVNNKVEQFGDSPSKDTLLKLFSFFEANSPLAIFQVNDTENIFKDEPELLEIKGGILVVPISHATNDSIIWFRKPQVEKVKWAGLPEKKLEETKAGYRLAPRSSFELWQQTVQNKSTPWSKLDVDTALAVVRLILEHEKNVANLANQAKSEFLANMSHELRTPMNAIIGVANILDKDHELSDNQKDLIKTLKVSSESLITLINDLLDMAKVESNKLKLERIPFNFAEIMENARSVMSVKANEKDLQLNFSYPDKKELDFLGDPNRIRQILLNLLSNAIKFTDQGFVNVLVKIRRKENLDSCDVILYVSDTGIGMSEKHIKRIFEKFTQADKSIARNYGGSGLGLAITKSFVDMMGGKISVTSLEGMGSQFQVEIPLDIAHTNTKRHGNVEEKKSLQPERTEVNPESKKKKILLVEDYEGNIVVVIYFLQYMGFETYVVNNGQQALDKIKEDKYDLVLMDVQMPIMDGFEATQRIREMQESGELYKCPIIGMTAHAFVGDSNRCIEAGMDDYIAKPFSNEDLKDMLERYLK